MTTNYNAMAAKENLARNSSAFGICARNGIMPVQSKGKGGALAVRNVVVPVRAKTAFTSATMTSNSQRTVLKEIHNKTINTKVGSLCKEVTNISIRPKQDMARKPIQQKTQRPLLIKSKKPLQDGAVQEEEQKYVQEKGDVKEVVELDNAKKSAGKLEEISAVLERSKVTETESVALPEHPSYSTLLLPAEVEDIDRNDKCNLLLVTNYIDDIYKYLRELEVKFPVKCDHLSGSKVNSRMRSILVNWLIEIHSEFHLLIETLYLSVAILDRFLQKDRTVTQANLQLVGSTAMFVGSKYEEMMPPEICDFVYISKNSFTKLDIMSMEFIMLKSLDLSLGRPSPIHFLRRFSKAAQATTEMHTLAKYALELCLLEYSMCNVRPSLCAAAALYTALHALPPAGSKAPWSSTLQHYTQYSESEVLPIAKKMATFIISAPSNKYQAVYKKYSSSKFGKMSMRAELGRLKALAS